MSGPDAGDSDEDASDDPGPDRGDPRDASSDDAGTPAETRQDESSTRHDASTDEASRVDGDPVARGEGTRAGTDAESGSRNPRTSDSRPARSDGASAGGAVTIEDDGVLRWFLKTENETVVLVRDIASSVAIVAVIGLILFGVSGVWPPLVAVESGSMEPNMERGDLIFVVADDRFVGDDPVDGTGIVTAENGVESGHEKFGNPGDVVVFRPDGSEYRTPVIHRAEFWVDEDENWVDKADEDIVGGATCDQIETCPADHAGFITKGDNNGGYDQQDRYRGAETDVVKPEWVTGKASFRIPWLGHVRLTFDRLLGATVAPSPAIELADSLPVEAETLAMGARTGTTFAAGSAVATGLAGSGAALHRYRR